MGWEEKLGLDKSAVLPRKTVTFGDESAVTANRPASIVALLLIFLAWGAFTGSQWIPQFLHVAAPFQGQAQFSYTVRNSDGTEQQANVVVDVTPRGEKAPSREAAEPRNGLAADDYKSTNVRIPASIAALTNDAQRGVGLDIVAINETPVVAGDTVALPEGEVLLTRSNRLFFKPDLGRQMDPIYLPPPEAVVSRFWQIATSSYRGSSLWEHVGWSLLRVISGFVLGAIVGIPLGFAMGLNSIIRGAFHPIVEFMRPVPPLALIPLIIIWFGIGEDAKIILLFLAALWIMAIAARAGASGVNIQKIHAAYSLGASKWQILTKVIFPNALPEIFTGARVAMGVCWGTVVAAELVAAEKGAGMMIMVASKFTLTDIVIMGIIVIGVIGYAIDVLMRMAEAYLVPWRGRS